MKSFKNKSGFTLIEIIVVLIIVGILAAIALPNLFSNVSKSRSEEALASISSMRPTAEGCIMKAAGQSESTVCTEANLFPGGVIPATTNFTYAMTPPAGATDTGYSFVATGRAALLATDILTVTRTAAAWPATGNVTCTAVGNLAGAC